MKKNEKAAILKLLGGVGVIVFLVGLFTPLYKFMYGLVAAIAIWILSGVVAAYFGVDKKKK